MIWVEKTIQQAKVLEGNLRKHYTTPELLLHPSDINKFYSRRQPKIRFTQFDNLAGKVLVY
jgi:hypothetical protein